MAAAGTVRGATVAKTDRTVSGAVAIELSFKLDQRLTRSMYMGDRWISPPTYTKVQEGDKLIVEARAIGRDKGGRQVEIDPEWRAEDLAMITVSPEKGKQVKLTILKEGQSAVTVGIKGISRKLTVRARQQNKVLIVDITGQVKEAETGR